MAASGCGVGYGVREAHAHNSTETAKARVLERSMFLVSGGLRIDAEVYVGDSSRLRGLTFELTGLRRQALKGRAEMMHHAPQPGLTVLAVAGPVERGVRPHRATLASEAGLGCQ